MQRGEEGYVGEDFGQEAANAECENRLLLSAFSTKETIRDDDRSSGEEDPTSDSEEEALRKDSIEEKDLSSQQDDDNDEHALRSKLSEESLQRHLRHGSISYLHGSEDDDDREIYSEAKTYDEEEGTKRSNLPSVTAATPLLNQPHDNAMQGMLFAKPPTIESLRMEARTGAYHASHGDFTLTMQHESVTWDVRFHRQTLLELHSSIKSILLQKAMDAGSSWMCTSLNCMWRNKPTLKHTLSQMDVLPSMRNFYYSPQPPAETPQSTLRSPIQRTSSQNVPLRQYSGSRVHTSPPSATQAIKRLHFPRSLLFVQSTALDDTKRKRISEDVVQYLHSILSNDWLCNLPQVYEFLRVSALTFDKTLGASVIEGYVRVQKHVTQGATLLKWHSCRWGCFLCNWACLPVNYTKRQRFWVVVKRHCTVFLAKPLDSTPQHVLLYDSRGFDLRKGFSTTGRKKVFFLYSNAWIADFKFPSRLEMKAWASVLTSALETNAPSTAWQNREHPNLSFAPVRDDASCTARYLIDGQMYFSEVLEALRLAQREIFISGWWITPDVSLERGDDPRIAQSTRLSTVLAERAELGVKVYVMMFSEVQLAMRLNSKFQESRLANVENIYVQRHPSFNLLGSKENWYWSHHEKLVVCDGGSRAFVGGIDLCWGRYDNSAHRLLDDGKSWPGIDYYNPRIRDIEDPRQFQRSLLDKADESQVRMPWHDVACELRGSIAKDVARHFIHQWNYSIESKTGSTYSLPVLIPQEHPQQAIPLPLQARAFHKVKCQVLRSLPAWSGAGTTSADSSACESSIQNAYLQAINSSQRYVYIENQFFVSGMSSDPLIGNRIANALYARISKAAAERAKFRVIILLPLLPAFEGGDLSDSSMRYVLYWQYRSICRGDNRKSLWEMLEDDPNVRNPADYVSFLSLRTFQPYDGHANVVSEMIYVHGKVMIIDDHVTFIGSANINDRSMLGSRDSEVCVQITDQEFDQGARLFGEPWALSGRFAKRLLRDLLGEHFHEATLPDSHIVLDDFLLHFDVLLRVAEHNTECFQSVFACIPSNEIKTFKELNRTLRRNNNNAPEPQQDKDKLPTISENASADASPPQQEEEEDDDDDAASSRSTLGKMKRFQSFSSFQQFNINANTIYSRLNDIQGSVVMFPLQFLSSAKNLKPKSGVVVTDVIFT